MAHTFKKFNALEGQVYTASGLNRMNFEVLEQDALYDFNKSYLLLNVGITSTDKKKDGTIIANSYQNWRWGNPGTGQKYDITSLIRNFRVENTARGCIENVINANVLSNSLHLQYLADKDQQKTQSFFNIYQSATDDWNGLTTSSPWLAVNTAEGDNISTIQNYQDASCILPLKMLPSGLAQTDGVEMKGGNTYWRFELENALNILDQGFENTADIYANVSVTSGDHPVTVSTIYGAPNTLMNLIQMPATYTQTGGPPATGWTLAVQRPYAYRLCDNAGTANSYPFVGSDAVSVNNIGPGFINVSYCDATEVMRTVTAQYTSIAVNGANVTLTLTGALTGATNAADGGIKNITVNTPLTAYAADPGGHPNQINVVVPYPTGAQKECPFFINQTISLYSPSLDEASNYETYKITNLDFVNKDGNKGEDRVVEFVLTLDSNLTYVANNPDVPLMYITPSADASAIWQIKSAQFVQALVNESGEMKEKRHAKMKDMNITKTNYLTWELESFTWGTPQSSFIRQWVLNPDVYAGILCTPTNGSLISVIDKCNNYRVVVDGTQLTNRAILVQNNGATQHTDWIKYVLKNYCNGLEVSQVQQLPVDQPGSVSIWCAPISDMRFKDMDSLDKQHLLEMQLFASGSDTMSAKTFYLYKLTLKQL